MSGALGSKRVGGVAKGNALTMSGALGSSREGKSQPKKKQPQPKVETKERKDVSRNSNRRDGGRGEKNNDRRGQGQRDAAGRHDGRGGRQNRRAGREAAAFDRLTRKDGSGPSERDQYNNGGRGGGQRGRDRGRGQDGRSGGRMSGNRRSRDDDFEAEQDYVEARRPAGRGGRGRGRGRGGPPSGGKWMRTNDQQADYQGEDEGYYEGYGQEGGYDESYDNYQNYHPPAWRGGYNNMDFQRGGRGRGGRGRGRRGGRGGGRASYVRTEEFEGGGDSTAQNGADGTDPAHPHANEKTMDESAEAAVGHPSPMVAANFGGRGSFGSYRGRGRGRGRGRWWRGGAGNNHFAGRSEVVNRIASKTWVRAKESSESTGNQDANAETAEG